MPFKVSAWLFYFFKIFGCGSFLKSLPNLLTVLFLLLIFCFFVFFFLVREACGILALPPGIEPTPPCTGR